MQKKIDDNASLEGKSAASTRGSGSNGHRGPWPIHVPASQCDYGSDGNAWIAFDRAGDFVFDEEHLYVGSEPRPRGDGAAAGSVPVATLAFEERGGATF
jgi:hypothetical protein